ncbi:MAG: SCP2 sterol-binding domain-containing protein [Actinobacteria bacterium]|nr:SCP2 sterol-binding domain-containing protein [Actinomycetota bacterium]
MPRFLSAEWIDAAAQAAAASGELAKATAQVQLVIQQIVTGTPGGEVGYVVAFDRGRTEIRAGKDPAADVTFCTDWDTAVGVATGATSAQDAFTTGRLQVRGDVGALLRHAASLTGLDTVFAEVQASTTY